MKYRLSLDLGVSSIGSAIINLNDDNESLSIVDAGVRIFKVSEGAEDRRLKRQARKNNERTKVRLKLLAKKLFEAGFWESLSQYGSKEIQDLSPYAIRAHAANHKLNSPNELGRALLHLAKHRGAGFIEAFNEPEDKILDDEEKPNTRISKKERKLSSYEILPEHLKSSGARTIGEYFNMRLRKSYKKSNLNVGNIVRQRKDYVGDNSSVDYAIPRYLVKDEFNIIWNKQANYYPELKDDYLKKEIYNILFFERPSAPFATADCIYVDGEKRLLKAHPLSERKRIYEEVNNIRLLTEIEKRKLHKTERDKVINELLLNGEKANKTSVRRILDFNKKTDIVFADEKGIKPYLYSTKEFKQIPTFANISEEKLIELAEFVAEPKILNDKYGRLYSESDLTLKLKEKLDISDERIIGELLAKLPKGRGSLGITATRKLLEIFETYVVSHREATDFLVRSGDDRFKAEEILAQEIQGKHKTSNEASRKR